MFPYATAKQKNDGIYNHDNSIFVYISMYSFQFHVFFHFMFAFNRSYARMIIIFGLVNLINNYAFTFDIPYPLHVIFRAVSPEYIVIEILKACLC